MGSVSLRYQQSNGRTYDNQIISHLERKNREKVDEGDRTTLVKITGCEYKISGESLSEALSHWGVISSQIREEVFEDPHDK